MSNKVQEDIEKLKNEKKDLERQVVSMANMLRFTLGIAIQARPEIEQLHSMVDSLYITKEDNGHFRN